MKIKKARQILKSLADDTRLRIINLLKKGEINVSDMCTILDTTQSNLSKHLSRLRLTNIVDDRREGNIVYYSLKKPTDKTHKELINVIISGLKELEIFKKDLEKLKKHQNKI